MGLPMEPAREILSRKFVSDNPAQRINLINEIQNLKFEKPGNLSIVIDVDDHTLGNEFQFLNRGTVDPYTKSFNS